MRIPTWITGCGLIFLASCASLPANDARPANDLELLRLGVEQLTRERQPQGAVTRAEDATNGGELFGLAIALEDTVWLSNDDKRRTRAFVDRATRRIELSRLPSCSWWQLGCKATRRAIERQLDSTTASP